MFFSCVHHLECRKHDAKKLLWELLYIYIYIYTYTNPPCLYKVLREDAEPELLSVQGNPHPVLG